MYYKWGIIAAPKGLKLAARLIRPKNTLQEIQTLTCCIMGITEKKLI